MGNRGYLTGRGIVSGGPGSGGPAVFLLPLEQWRLWAVRRGSGYWGPSLEVRLIGVLRLGAAVFPPSISGDRGSSAGNPDIEGRCGGPFFRASEYWRPAAVFPFLW